MLNAPGWHGGLDRSPGRLSFTGQLGSAKRHVHAAVQIIQVGRGHVDLHVAGEILRVESQVAIPTGLPHALVAGADTYGGVTYLEPELVGTVGPELELDPDVITAWLEQSRSDTIQHPALEEALARARDLISGPLLLADLAGEVGISASRLGHLFAEGLGLSFPRWRRWVRLEQALIEVGGGVSLTEAAHAAGFADSAHLTRSCRQMFGVTPSEALNALQRRRT